jgi:hypothetical protein
MFSYRTLGVDLAVKHKRLIVADRTVLIGSWYRNSLLCQMHWVRLKLWKDKCLMLVSEEGDYIRQLYAGYMCLRGAPRACGHNILQRLKVWHEGQEEHLCR